MADPPAAVRLSPPVPRSEGIPIQVIGAAEGMPLAGAIVHYLDPSVIGKDLLMAAMLEGESLFELSRKHGPGWRADEGGNLIVPRPAGRGGLLCGEHGQLRGMTELRSSDGPLILELARQDTLAVRVIASNGSAVAEAPVGIYLEALGGRGPKGRFQLLERRTDEAGRLSFTDLGLMLQGKTGGGHRVSVGLAILGPSEIAESVDPDKLPEDPVVLIMPPTGSIEVTVLDASGEPARGGVEVRAALATSLEAVSSSGPVTSTARPLLEVQAIEGRALFSHVEIGLDLELGARSPTGGLEAEEFIAGPQVAGQRVTARLQLGEGLAVLVARILDPEGEPLRSAKLSLATREKSPTRSTSQQERGRTDEEGRFERALPPDLTEGMTRTITFKTEGEEDGGLSALVDLSGSLPAGLHDLGDIRLGIPPLIASGRVTGPRGVPLEGAAIRLEHKWRFEPGDEFFHWSWGDETPATSRADGSFEIRGWTPHEELRLSASRTGWNLRERVEIAPGAREVVLVMTRAGSVVGSLLLDRDVPEREIGLTLRKTETGRPKNTRPRDGEFLFEPLERGTYTLTLDVADRHEPLLSIENILVRVGEVCRDPRLQEIDLRDVLRTIEVRVLGPEGQPLERAEIRFLDRDGQWIRHSRGWGTASTVLTLSQPGGVDLEVTAEGYRRRRVEAVDEDIEIRLDPGIPVRLVVENLPDLDPPLVAGILLIEDELGRPQGYDFLFDGASEVELLLDRPGTYRPLFRLWNISGRGSHSSSIAHAPRDTPGFEPIEVDESGGVFALTIPETLLDDALGRL